MPFVQTLVEPRGCDHFVETQQYMPYKELRQQQLSTKIDGTIPLLVLFMRALRLLKSID